MATEQNVPSIDSAPSLVQEVLTTSEAEKHLDDWAEQAEPPKVRGPDGKFRKSSDTKDFGQAAEVLKNTMKATMGDRKPPVEREEEPEQVEEEGEVEERQPSRKVRAIVNGEEEEIDLSDDEFRKVNAIQASRAAQKAWREAAQMRKEANELRRALEVARQNVVQDPMSLFKVLGIPEETVLNFAQQTTINKLAETIDPNTGQPYTPEQQRIIQLQNELKRRELTEKEMQEKQQLQEQEHLKDVIRQDVDRKFTAALKETGLPPTQYTMMRLADLMQAVGPDVDPAQVAPLVLEDMVNEVRHTIYSMPMEVAVEVLGDEFLQELRKYDIQRARDSKDKFGRNPAKYPNNSQQRPAQKRGDKIVSQSEAADWLERWAEGT